ncbi:hypothetical protein L3Y34_009196 [Caenorhabditis briggsae]|uniref:Nuclear receptor domain-containing protein n=1 Tax=Caenorhabditis briggsae TaxID=6238 RepID=A0AAE9A3L7_CAEBR|nr:hypothetical protein L3Y34_009196 [Caenorhabditis briggsae]
MVHVARNCVICQRLTSDFSYGVDCCNACKMFFRRHVVKESPLKPCVSGNGECSSDTLAGCQFCRFHKCLQSGMTLEPLIPKPPLNELFEKLSKLDSYRYQILCNYYPIDPDLNVATVLFFKRVIYTERDPGSQMNFTSWIYMSALATIEFMKMFAFLYLAKPEDQLILTKSSFMNVSSFCAAFRSDLLSAGISESSVVGISVIAKDFYAANKPALGQQMDHETKATLFKQFMEKVGEFIQTQSSEDQAALKKLFKEKKADFKARMAAAN